MELAIGTLVQAALVHHKLDLHPKPIGYLREELNVAVDRRIRRYGVSSGACEYGCALIAINVGKHRSTDFYVGTNSTHFTDVEGVRHRNRLHLILLMHTAHEVHRALDRLFAVPISSFARGIHGDIDGNTRPVDRLNNFNKTIFFHGRPNAPCTRNSLGGTNVHLAYPIAVALMQCKQIAHGRPIVVERHRKL